MHANRDDSELFLFHKSLSLSPPPPIAPLSQLFFFKNSTFSYNHQHSFITPSANHFLERNAVYRVCGVVEIPNRGIEQILQNCAIVILGNTLRRWCKIEKFMKQKSPKSTLLADNTRGLITTKQTKTRPVASAIRISSLSSVQNKQKPGQSEGKIGDN